MKWAVPFCRLGENPLERLEDRQLEAAPAKAMVGGGCASTNQSESAVTAVHQDPSETRNRGMVPSAVSQMCNASRVDVAQGSQ